MQRTYDKTADLAGLGIGTYEVDRVLPNDYHSLLTPGNTNRLVCGQEVHRRRSLPWTPADPRYKYC